MDQPGYYKTLARSVGIQADKLGEAANEVFQAPTDDKLRVLAVLFAVARNEFVIECGTRDRIDDILAIVSAEREWLHAHGGESLS